MNQLKNWLWRQLLHINILTISLEVGRNRTCQNINELILIEKSLTVGIMKSARREEFHFTNWFKIARNNKVVCIVSNFGRIRVFPAIYFLKPVYKISIDFSGCKLFTIFSYQTIIFSIIPPPRMQISTIICYFG